MLATLPDDVTALLPRAGDEPLRADLASALTTLQSWLAQDLGGNAPAGSAPTGNPLADDSARTPAETWLAMAVLRPREWRCHDPLGSLDATGGRVVVTQARTAARAADVLGLTWERSGVVAVGPYGTEVVTLVTGGVRSAERVLSAARGIAIGVRRLDPGARCAVSASLDRLSDLPAAIQDARDACLLATACDGPVLVDDVWATLTLLRLHSQVLSCLPVGTPLATLAEHDRRTGTDLVRTLSVWLAHDRQAPVAAEQLHVHVNTLRYRLRRAAAISGLDLNDLAQRLVTELVAWLTPAAAGADERAQLGRAQ